MKQLFVSIAFSLLILHEVKAQNIIRHAPIGFDSVQRDIPHGRIDTIKYKSKTVGVTRRALIYTPPGYSKEKTISGLVFVAWYWRRREGVVH